MVGIGEERRFVRGKIMFILRFRINSASVTQNITYNKNPTILYFNFRSGVDPRPFNGHVRKKVGNLFLRLAFLLW